MILMKDRLPDVSSHNLRFQLCNATFGVLNES